MNNTAPIRLLLLHCLPQLADELARELTVYKADNAAESIKTLAEVEVDIAVVDQESGGSDALEFIRRLRSPRMGKVAALQVIFLVQASHPDDIRRMVRQGVDHIMVKPLSPRMLIESAEQLLAQPTPQITTGSYRGPDRRRIPLPAFLGSERRQK
jgi:DNA-binding NarL/FixJ family response regulator